MAQTSRPLVKRADSIEHEPLDAAEGLKKGVLLGPSDGTPNLALRRFVLDGNSSVPKHTNKVEHEQYVLEGEYVVGIDDDEHVVSAGDSIHVPAGTVHWYRNENDAQGAFICAVPNEDDEIELAE